MIPTGYVTRRYAALQMNTTIDVIDLFIEYGSLSSKTIGESTYVSAEDIAAYRDRGKP